MMTKDYSEYWYLKTLTPAFEFIYARCTICLVAWGWYRQLAFFFRTDLIPNSGHFFSLPLTASKANFCIQTRKQITSPLVQVYVHQAAYKTPTEYFTKDRHVLQSTSSSHAPTSGHRSYSVDTVVRPASGPASSQRLRSGKKWWVQKEGYSVK